MSSPADIALLCHRHNRYVNREERQINDSALLGLRGSPHERVVPTFRVSLQRVCTCGGTPCGAAAWRACAWPDNRIGGGCRRQETPYWTDDRLQHIVGRRRGGAGASERHPPSPI